MKSYQRVAFSILALSILGILYNLGFDFLSNSHGLSTRGAFYIGLLLAIIVSTTLCLLPGLEKLKGIHPIIMFTVSALDIYLDPSRHDGYLFYSLSVLLSYEYGYLKRAFFYKSAAIVFALLSIVVSSVLFNQVPFQKALSTSIMTLGFFFMLRQIFRDRIGGYSRPPIDFHGLGITGVGEDICRLIYSSDKIDSKTLAQLLSVQLGDDFTTSYIDTHLTPIFRTLGVESRAELKAYLSRFRME